jgi:hypothetical protein
MLQGAHSLAVKTISVYRGDSMTLHASRVWAEHMQQRAEEDGVVASQVGHEVGQEGGNEVGHANLEGAGLEQRVLERQLEMQLEQQIIGEIKCMLIRLLVHAPHSWSKLPPVFFALQQRHWELRPDESSQREVAKGGGNGEASGTKAKQAGGQGQVGAAEGGKKGVHKGGPFFELVELPRVCQQKPILEAGYRHCTASATGAEAAAAAAAGIAGRAGAGTAAVQAVVPLPCASDELALMVMRAQHWFDWAQTQEAACATPE